MDISRLLAYLNQIKIEYSYLILASLPDKCQLSGFYDHLICAIFYVILIKGEKYCHILQMYAIVVYVKRDKPEGG